MGCIPGWFSWRRGAAYGIISTGSSLGGVVFPIMVSRLMGRVVYGWTMRIGAFVILGLLGVANLTVRARSTRTGGGLGLGLGLGLSREGLARPFGEVKMVLLVLGFVCLAFGVFIPINYIVVQAVDAGMSAALAEYLVAMLSAGVCLGAWRQGCCPIDCVSYIFRSRIHVKQSTPQTRTIPDPNSPSPRHSPAHSPGHRPAYSSIPPSPSTLWLSTAR